ncbi:pentraxin-related protein PTX3 [Dipodomys spectabilis]|uniref:pentraxin-related protein PTX3 n=1 Tax=Dipodomys spectabilis TaxID=105255 RepID=UPI001C53D020|nr:pentraxin-related protein PTX3 [Dipodomys spectabilis]
MRLPALLLCALSAAAGAGPADDYELLYLNLDNELEPAQLPTDEPTPCDCRREPSEWDKLFTMLENSQMREAMLLEATDAVLRGEMQRLRAELGRLAGGLARPCAAGPGEARLARALDELLQGSRDASRRLARLEDAEARRPAAPAEAEAGRALGAMLRELRETRAELRAVRRWAARHGLPAGCEVALVFPMRSPRIFGSVHPVRPLQLHAFSACLWVRASEVLNKTVLFSYGTEQSPREMQLSLGPRAVELVVGGEGQGLAAARAVVPGRWTHLCGTWASRGGRASLWADGQLLAAAAEVAAGHQVPAGGALRIGQEGGRGAGSVDDAPAFSGWLTGFNIWDRVLSEAEIREAGGDESCHVRGNVVGWGITEILPHGGAQYLS